MNDDHAEDTSFALPATAMPAPAVLAGLAGAMLEAGFIPATRPAEMLLGEDTELLAGVAARSLNLDELVLDDAPIGQDLIDLSTESAEADSLMDKWVAETPMLPPPEKPAPDLSDDEYLRSLLESRTHVFPDENLRYSNVRAHIEHVTLAITALTTMYNCIRQLVELNTLAMAPAIEALTRERDLLITRNDAYCRATLVLRSLGVVTVNINQL